MMAKASFGWGVFAPRRPTSTIPPTHPRPLPPLYLSRDKNLTRLKTASILTAVVWVFVSCSQAAPTPAPSLHPAPAKTTISSTQAAAHVGERETVCGSVVDSRYATSSKGRPTFLNFDRAYPNHTFAVVIWGSERAKFPDDPEIYYRGKQVCATGLIESYESKPEMITHDASQLEIVR